MCASDYRYIKYQFNIHDQSINILENINTLIKRERERENLSFSSFISYELFIISRKGEYKEREANLCRKIMQVNTIKNGKRVKPLRKH